MNNFFLIELTGLLKIVVFYKMENALNHNIQSGDLILFATNKWYSDVIEIGDGSVFSHCGIALVDPTYIDPSLNGIYLLESGKEPFPDSIDHKYHFGVQIVPLIDVINEYVIFKEGTVFHRSLNVKRDSKFESNLAQAFQNVKYKPYNCDPLDWLEALFGMHWFDTQITSRFWCSALVAYIYVQTGIIENNVDWTLVTPREWSSVSKCKFIFLNQASLDQEIRLI
jgi:hypothetical protein